MRVTFSCPVAFINSSFVKSLMSRNLGTFFHCLFKIFNGYSAFSHCATVSKPAASAAKSIPPIPVNKLRCVSFLLILHHFFKSCCHKFIKLCIFRESVFKWDDGIATVKKSTSRRGIFNTT